MERRVAASAHRDVGEAFLLHHGLQGFQDPGIALTPQRPQDQTPALTTPGSFYGPLSCGLHPLMVVLFSSHQPCIRVIPASTAYLTSAIQASTKNLVLKHLASMSPGYFPRGRIFMFCLQALQPKNIIHRMTECPLP